MLRNSAAKFGDLSPPLLPKCRHCSAISEPYDRTEVEDFRDFQRLRKRKQRYLMRVWFRL
jgi:hypothetical protein